MHPSMSVVHKRGHFSEEGRLISLGPEPPEMHGQEVGWCLRGQVFVSVHVSPGPGESLEGRGWWRRNARPTLEITRVRGQGGDGAVLS